MRRSGWAIILGWGVAASAQAQYLPTPRPSALPPALGAQSTLPPGFGAQSTLPFNSLPPRIAAQPVPIGSPFWYSYISPYYPYGGTGTIINNTTIINNPVAPIPERPNTGSLVPIVTIVEAHPDTARLTLNVPPTAEVMIDGESVKLSDAAATAESPKLADGKKHTFAVKVRFKDGSVETRDIVLLAGEDASLSLFGKK